jgi:hypothetical protein
MAQQGSRRGRVTHNVRRVWPFVMMAWERWQSLSPQEKERYKRQAREYADRGRQMLQNHRGGGGPKRR